MLNFSKKTECDDNRLNSYRVSSGQRLEVLCSCIVSPNLLFVQKCSDVSAIDEFSDKLNAEYNDLELSYVKTSDDYNVGDFCVTRYSADEKWYRAVILNKLELDGEYEVRFIDFGNSEVVKADTLRKMQPYFEGISPFAVKCALTGLDVIPPEVVPDALYDALNNILQYGELTVVAEFHNLSTDGKFMVKLIIDNTDVASELRRIFDLPLPNDHDKLALGEMLEVFISHVESPSNFWFQRGVDDEEIQILQQKVATYCNDATHDPDFKIDEGAWCLARFSEDTSWYRAKTCLPWDSNGVTVHFLDFGNSEVVGVEDLLQMPDEFLNIPVLGFHGALQGIGNDEWTQDKISQFKEVTGHGGHLLKAKVVAKEGNKYYVTLKYNDVDVIEMLTTNGSQLVDDAIPMQEKNQTEQQGVKFVVGEVFEVLLSHADSPSDFWVQRSSDEATIQQLQSDIDIHCNNIMNSGDMKNDEFSTGSLCLAQFSSDDQWYRAKIINENDNGTVHVRFIDFGNAETVSKSRLLTIPDMFVDLPIFAVNCTLDGFKELRNEQRATETLDRFNELTGHGEFMLNANILEEFDGKYIITLHHDGIDIYQAMMADNMEGNFTPTDDILVNKVAEPDIHFGEKIEVYISHILSPSNFWVQNVTKETEMNELLDKLNSTDTTASASASCDQFVKGKYCVARYSLDERLYRSVILSVDMETKSATVLFIDYGNQECVPLSEIHEISPQFLSVPPFAHPCRLVGLQVPADGTWNDNVIKAFRESVNDGNSTYLAEFIRRDNEIFVLRLLNMGIDVTESMLAVDGVQASDSDNWTTSVVNTTCSKDSLLNSSDKLEIHMEEDVDVDLEPCVSTPNETQMSEEVSDIDLKNDEKSFGPVCDKNISLNVDSLKSTPIEEAQRMLESPLPPGSEEESFKDCNCDELSEPELEIDIARDEELTADGLPYDDEMDVSINPVSVLHSTPVGVIAAERQLCEAEGDSFNSVSHPKAHLHPDDECDNWDRHPVLSFREGPSNDVNMSSELEGNELGHQAESSTAVDPIVNSCSEEAVLGNEDQLHEMTKSEENSVPLMLNVPEDDIGVLSDSDEAMILSPHPDTTTVDQGYSEIGVTGNLSD